MTLYIIIVQRVQYWFWKLEENVVLTFELQTSPELFSTRRSHLPMPTEPTLALLLALL